MITEMLDSLAVNLTNIHNAEIPGIDGLRIGMDEDVRAAFEAQREQRVAKKKAELLAKLTKR